jgi:hypothetical protein
MHVSTEQTEHESTPEQPEEQQNTVAEHVTRQRRRAARFASPRPGLAALLFLLLIPASVYAFMNPSMIAQAIASVRSSLAGGSPPQQQVASVVDALPTQPATTVLSDATPTALAIAFSSETATTSGSDSGTSSVVPQQPQSPRPPAIDLTPLVFTSRQLLAVEAPANTVVDQQMMNAKLLELDNTLAAEIQAISSANSSEIVGAYQAASYVTPSSAVSDETFTGGTISSLAVSGTGTSTFAGGINLNGGCFAVNGACMGASGGSGTVGSGTQGQFAFYNAAGTTLSATSSLFLTPSGNIGIGTSTAAGKLAIQTNGTPGNYVATSTGIFMYDALGQEKSRLRKSAQDDKWSFCLTAGTLCPANQEKQ